MNKPAAEGIRYLGAYVSCCSQSGKLFTVAVIVNDLLRMFLRFFIVYNIFQMNFRPFKQMFE